MHTEYYYLEHNAIQASTMCAIVTVTVLQTNVMSLIANDSMGYQQHTIIGVAMHCTTRGMAQ